MVTWLTVVITMLVTDDDDGTHEGSNYKKYLDWFSSYSIINVYSAVVIITAIVHLRCKVKQLETRTKMASSREGLMVTHAVLFFICIVLNVCSLIFDQLHTKNLNHYVDASNQYVGRKTTPAAKALMLEQTGTYGRAMCRYLEYHYIFQAANICMVAVVLILVAYMSQEFSKPLT